ncbi:hypothetical protein XCV2098 [Xanthomonas euvesicatoria pv. vesicatoria str. 85-10]|uniref:Uncharacterized protein n=1 Tax=Xanthomonas euvesicatoria pv. vesicatoria (strain 85-10) TaxID=316273 RepID=Q3BTT4_XANE5|nr:hypothetical protein XCV2098 [Xanthomonas euvesicatoria pv. vesicatoria str. 85-10]
MACAPGKIHERLLCNASSASEKFLQSCIDVRHRLHGKISLQPQCRFQHRQDLQPTRFGAHLRHGGMKRPHHWSQGPVP